MPDPTQVTREYLGRQGGPLMQKLSAALAQLEDETGYKSVSASWEVRGAMLTVTLSVGERPEEDDA